MRKLFLALFVLASALPAFAAQTYFVRADGGTRYSANATTGQCSGKADAPYSGTGTNQPCAFKDVRYLWLTGVVGEGGWVMAGGDTAVIRPSSGGWRIGYNNAQHTDIWCQYADAFCAMPTPPGGTSAQHTRILGGCAYDGNCKPVTGYPYTGGNLTQIFGGYGLATTINLGGAAYVDFAGLEITSHNGACTRHGYPQYPGGCSNSAPYSDYSDNGINTDQTTSNVSFTDVYIHGFSNGLFGPIGGPVSLTRVAINFNTFAGWNFDDAAHHENGAGSSLTQSYVTMVGNGCLEEYPITHTQFPAKACWDSSSGGFGDAWSGQAHADGSPAHMDSFTCDHCTVLYNTKDGALGPHTLLQTLTLTNSVWYGNMGQQGKWASGPASTTRVLNNLIVGNCFRMSETVPGAVQNFSQGTGLPGSYLTNYCRAAGNTYNFSVDANASFLVANNTIVSDGPTVFDLDCSTDVSAHGCGSTPYQFRNNIFLGYTNPAVPGSSGQAPGLYYKNVPEVVIQASNNIEFGIRNGDTCGTSGILCVDPKLLAQPAQGALPPEAALDALNYALSTTSPARNAGIAVAGRTTDLAGAAIGASPSIGALEPGSSFSIAGILGSSGAPVVTVPGAVPKRLGGSARVNGKVN